MNPQGIGRCALRVAAAAVAVAGISLSVTPAGASTHANASGTHARPASKHVDASVKGPAGNLASTNIDGWHPTWCFTSSSYYYCLWYSPNGANAGWGSTSLSTPTISGTFFLGSGAGKGAPVRNDAASMSNGTGNCHVTTWVYPNYQGAFNWLDATWGGNLTSNLRNNEASINVNNCS